MTAATIDFPSDWLLQRLGDIFSFANGVNADKASYGKGCRFINVLETITYSHIHGPEVPGRITLPGSVVDAYIVEKGDILFNRTSETDADVGLASAYLGEERVVFGGFVIRGRPVKEAFDSTYAGYALRAPFIRSQVISMGQGAVRSNIGQESLKRVVAPVPPAAEQRAIAKALSDVDALLARLDRLIAKKRDIKQAAMQQILTGQTRLKGFYAEWSRATLGELFTFKNGLNKAKQFFGFGTPIVNYMDVFSNGKILCTRLAGRVSLSKQELSNFDVRKGDVLFTRTSETPEEIGLAAVVGDEPSETVFSGFLLRGRPRSRVLCDEFKAYCFRSSFVRLQIVSKASYTTRALTNGRLLSGVVLPVPPLAEQAAIAAALSDMDTEILALETRRDKTRALKQAMMQELLTGRIRLI